MKLSFQVTSYENNAPMLEVTEGEIVSRHGCRHRSFPYIKHIPVPPPMLNVKERDLSYTSRHSGVEEPTFMAQSPAQETGKKWHCKPVKTSSDEADQTHLANIRRSLEHRLRIAKAKGDQNLVRLLEDESKQLTFCGFN